MFDDFEDFKKNMAKSDEEHAVPLNELLTNEFIHENTKFDTVYDFFENSGFSIATEEEFAAIPENEMDDFVANNSNFDTWDEMLGSASQEYIFKKLGF